MYYIKHYYYRTIFWISFLLILSGIIFLLFEIHGHIQYCTKQQMEYYNSNTDKVEPQHTYTNTDLYIIYIVKQCFTSSQLITSNMTPFSRMSVTLRNMCSSSTITWSKGMSNSGWALQPGSLCQFWPKVRFSFLKNDIGLLRSFLLKKMYYQHVWPELTLEWSSVFGINIGKRISTCSTFGQHCQYTICMSYCSWQLSCPCKEEETKNMSKYTVVNILPKKKYACM